jgi:hypothetical protein
MSFSFLSTDDRERYHQLKLAHFPVISSMSLATRTVSDAVGNSKGVMSQDLDVSLPCHCNLQSQCQGRYFSTGGGILRGWIELGFRTNEIETLY